VGLQVEGRRLVVDRHARHDAHQRARMSPHRGGGVDEATGMGWP
jgi:hypothetical protein